MRIAGKIYSDRGNVENETHVGGPMGRRQRQGLTDRELLQLIMLPLVLIAHYWKEIIWKACLVVGILAAGWLVVVLWFTLPFFG